MKKSVLKLGLISMVFIGMISCQNKEKELSDKRISELEQYVDSLKEVNAEDRQANWDKIAADFEIKATNANDALVNLKDEERNPSQVKVDAATAKYDEFKVATQTKIEAVKIASKPKPNQILRDRLFGAGKIGEDMNFSWVNKNNILKTYDSFFEAYKTNKGSFTREDYDEIKLMYEALDSRKNTVENEGLSSEDNNKIASIKFKFGPMFKINRMGAKSRETAEAKE
jgi:hypothetical protein